MQAKTFISGIRAILVSLPFGKKADTEDLQFLWLTIDDRVKDSVTDEMWVYACRKVMETWSPEHQSSQPIHMQVLCFLYKEQWNSPCYEWGLKDYVCEQFNLPQGYGSDRLQASATGRDSKGLLDSGESRQALAGLDFQYESGPSFLP